MFCQLLFHLRSGERLKTSSLFKAIDLWTAQHNLFHPPNVSFLFIYLFILKRPFRWRCIHLEWCEAQEKPALINQKHKNPIVNFTILDSKHILECLTVFHFVPGLSWNSKCKPNGLIVTYITMTWNNEEKGRLENERLS